MMDVAHHLVNCTHGLLRRKIEQYIIEFYYKKLLEFSPDPSTLEKISVETVGPLKIQYTLFLAPNSLLLCTS